MGRRASGGKFLEQAKACLAEARTVEALRQAQAVVLPLELGLSLAQTAASDGCVSRLGLSTPNALCPRRRRSG